MPDARWKRIFKLKPSPAPAPRSGNPRYPSGNCALMDRYRQHGRIFVKDRFRAVAVVHIPIQNSHPQSAPARAASIAMAMLANRQNRGTSGKHDVPAVVTGHMRYRDSRSRPAPKRFAQPSRKGGDLVSAFQKGVRRSSPPSASESDLNSSR